MLLKLREEGEIRMWRDEPYPVALRFEDEPLMKIERGAVPDFGVRAFGVHVNGYVEKADGLYLWVGRRSMTKPTGPGKLDHIVAGGQPHGIGIRENMIKECAEEAAMPESLASKAVQASTVSYICEQPEGLRDDICFCFDIALPESFEPVNTDGEVDAFYLWPIEEVMTALRQSEAFKFNVALVNIDFLVRRGLIPPDDMDYEAIVSGLRLPE